VLTKFDVVLHLLGKTRFDKGSHLWANAALLTDIRNELVHYKSRLGAEMEPPGKKPEPLIKRLKQRQFVAPPWVAPSPATNYFPLQCLSAHCARWAVTTAVAFIDEFYKRLGITARLDSYRDRLKVNARVLR
jgi:hypothetical protein